MKDILLCQREKNVLQRFGERTREVGFLRCILGLLKRERYRRMQKKYGFDPWHISPYELRKYVQEVSNYISLSGAEVVVDIGCGLGELLRSLPEVPVRAGYDINKNVLEAAETLGGRICFEQGSFSEVRLEQPIDFLVTLNFMHGSPEEVWRPRYHEIAVKNEIRHFIVDTLIGRKEGYSLDFRRILPENYERAGRLGPFRNGRFVEIYKKR